MATLDGYVFKLESGMSIDDSSNDDWEIVMVTQLVAEPLGMTRVIDGSRCDLYRCPNGFRSETYACLRGHAK